VIAQLKAEVAELKQQGDDYAKVHADLLEAEYQLKLLGDEKYRIERDAKEREDGLQLRIDDLQDDLKRLSNILNGKQEQLKATDTDLIETKKRCDFLMKELARLKNDIGTLEANFKDIQAENRMLQSKMEASETQNKAAHNEIDSLMMMNERLTKINTDKINKEREYEKDIRDLEGEIQRFKVENEALKRNNVSKDKELEIIENSKMTLRREVDSLKGSCSRYEDQLDERDHKIKDMEEQLSQLNNRLTITMSKIDSRENYINSLNDKVTKAEERSIRAESEASRLKKENDSLHNLLDKYRSDIEAHKKFKEDQMMQKYELEQQKKQLEREVLSKDIEARTAKRELEKLQDVKDKLADDRYQLNQELEALKEHAELLESQNDNVNSQLTLSYTVN